MNKKNMAHINDHSLNRHHHLIDQVEQFIKANKHSKKQPKLTNSTDEVMGNDEVTSTYVRGYN